MPKTRYYIKIISQFLILTSSVISQDYSKEIAFEKGKLVYIESDNLPVKPRVGLVLSGGGSRGFSHIGVLQVLDSLDIKIDLITGTSIGSVVGGLYSAGYSANEIEEVTYSINWSEIFSDAPQRTTLFLGQKTEQDRYLLSLSLDLISLML